MTVAIKICGLSDETSVRAVSKACADFAGFVHFAPSPRHVSLERAATLKTLLSPEVKSVAVLVDPNDALLTKVRSVFNPDFVQLHGKETPARLREIKKKFPGIKLIKAIKVGDVADIKQAASFYPLADMLLFDSKPPATSTLPGGNGVPFGWSLMKTQEIALPWFLSGGLNAGNIPNAVRESGAKMIDVSSGVEAALGVKDPELIAFFVKAAKTL